METLGAVAAIAGVAFVCIRVAVVIIRCARDDH